MADSNSPSASLFAGLDSLEDDFAVPPFIDSPTPSDPSAAATADTTTTTTDPASAAFANPNRDLPLRNSTVSSSPSVGTLPAAAAATTAADSQSLFGSESHSHWGLDGPPLFDTAFNGDSFLSANFYPQIWGFQGADSTAAAPSRQESAQARAALFPDNANASPTGASPADSVVRPQLPQEILNTLTPAQQEKLKSIAMPAHLQYRSPKSEPSPGSSMSGGGGGGGNDKGATSSPEGGPDLAKNGSSRKRKSSADVEDDDDDDDLDGQQPVKKTAHNMIEKRYRTNLNDKIAALRDSVPALRIMCKSARGEDTSEDREELHGLTPAHKLNKATVLSKATEYIRHLEKRNNRLLEENNSMQARINAFEKLFMAGALTTGIQNPMQQSPPLQQYGPDLQTYLNTPMATPRGAMDPPGLIPVPDDMRKILTSQQMTAGRPYGVPAQFQAAAAAAAANPALARQQQIQQQQQQMQAGRWANGAAPYFGKLMVGSLAGLMVLEAVRETEASNETPEGRGLFAVPLPLLRPLLTSTHFSVGGYTFSAARLFATLKLLLLFGALLWAFVPSLFAPRPPPKSGRKSALDRGHGASSLQAVPSLASPIHVRRRAWLTAIQTVWVPRHNFVLEAAALVLKTMKFTLRNTIGVRGYQLLTGLTEEQETARVKAWTIALDAQLAGGDVEINKSRLTLTLLASGTLPDTPQRLMMKALHIRVLLWQQDILPGAFNVLAAKLARSRWNEAKQLHRMLGQLRRAHSAGAAAAAAASSATTAPSATIDEDLPEHLAVLLEQECDDVLNDVVVQRAHNLAWNRYTTHNAQDMVDGMDSVVDDPAVRSPMDAVAAWYSTMLLQRLLSLGVVGDDGGGSGGGDVPEAELDLAVRVAPIGSHAQVRALVARTFLLDARRGAHIAAALQAMAPSIDPDKHPDYGRGLPPLIDAPVSPAFPPEDTRMALRCAQALAQLDRSAAPPRWALDVVNAIVPPPDARGMSLLGFAAAFRLMGRLHTHPVGREVCAPALERLAGCLRIWIGGPEGDVCGLEPEVRRQLVDRCLRVTKSVVGMEADPGYGSMSDCGDHENGC